DIALAAAPARTALRARRRERARRAGRRFRAAGGGVAGARRGERALVARLADGHGARRGGGAAGRDADRPLLPRAAHRAAAEAARRSRALAARARRGGALP